MRTREYWSHDLPACSGSTSGDLSGPPAHGRASRVQKTDPERVGPHTKLLSSALSQSIHWLPCWALASRCQLAMAPAIAAPSPLISRARVSGLYLVRPAAMRLGLHSACSWARAPAGL